MAGWGAERQGRKKTTLRLTGAADSERESNSTCQAKPKTQKKKKLHEKLSKDKINTRTQPHTQTVRMTGTQDGKSVNG